MRVTDDHRVVTSASDLTAFAGCEFAFLRQLDARLGRVPMIEEPTDALNERAKALGFVHEERVLDELRGEYATVVELPGRGVPVEELAERTLAALHAGADVIYQGAFVGEDFVGYADFLVRHSDGRYQVQDSKLARRPKVTALMQLAAYADRLRRHGFDPHPVVRLILGDRSVSDHQLKDIEPVFGNRWSAMRAAIDGRLAADGPVRWDDPAVARCGRCAWCTPELEATDDLFLVGGIRGGQRQALLAAGIRSLAELAANRTEKIDGMTRAGLAGLQAQARQQLEPTRADGAPTFRVHDAAALGAIPAPSPGDLFFDFEGDPLYSERATSDDETRWGLDYLFGFIDPDRRFTAYLAHNLAQEKLALAEFLADVARRRETHPDLHIYHYAAYEQTHLLSLAARHGIGEDAVDDLLREGVLVDLYPIVKRAVRIGERSYSLKVVEKVFRSQKRGAEVQNAADSIEEYVRFRDLRDAGEAEEAERVLAQILAYNEDDCVSTLELRDWLQGLARAAGVSPAPPEPEPEDAADAGPAESPLAARLQQHAGDRLSPDRTAAQSAWGLLSSAIDFHRRERKRFWQEHFTRLKTPIDEWANSANVFAIEDARVEEDWHKEDGQRSLRRVLRLRGAWGAGSRVVESRAPFVLFEVDASLDFSSGRLTAPIYRPAHSKATFLEVSEGEVLLEERLGERTADAHAHLPIALTGSAPIETAPIESAIAEWAESALHRAPELPADAIGDLLLRRPPLAVGREPDPGASPEPGASTSPGVGTSPYPGASTSPRVGTSPDTDPIASLTATLLNLPHTYLAVQGPPGTGKTYTGGRVIAELAGRHQWRVGVVAQSHTTVQNFLESVAEAGLPAEAIAKTTSAREPDDTAPWSWLKSTQVATFLHRARSAGRGAVVGGTAWTFANASQIPRGSLDLLVIDEAGQFSLAMTIAAAVAAKRVLLLGDPQQLPQVSQAQHPEPVQTSALGFVAAGADVLPPEYGVFLPLTRRMSPELTAVVSHLSYEDRLAAHPCTAERLLEGVAPGLHPIPVEHADDTTSSVAEARRVVELVRDLVERPWTAPPAATRPLTASDVIIVSPYNAQVDLIASLLGDAGLGEAEVGTVDRFQGREKPVAIVSLAVSSPELAPRGLDFVLSKNRLNVAISRAQWAAYLVHSPAIADHLPQTPDGVARLSAFLGLVGQR
ncbi:MAG: TM0106 family RecB-like putative nuclease [Micrococcales bacterium]|nr:TM0106 family RecB-like putative nuclease [Micrococcales bacterium]